MKTSITPLFILLVFVQLSIGCNSNDETSEYHCPMECEAEKVYADKGSCPVCKMDLVVKEEKVVDDSHEIDPNSIFNLESKWRTQNSDEILLKQLKGDILVVVMFYATCETACPRLIADMKMVHDELGNNKGVNYVLVSIDPTKDTPEKLKSFAIENDLNSQEWTFLNGSVENVREFANVLSVKYKEISPTDFSHSNIISVFDQKGVLQYQREGLGIDNEEIVQEVSKLQ